MLESDDIQHILLRDVARTARDAPALAHEALSLLTTAPAVMRRQREGLMSRPPRSRA
jgi:hypothetical protein